MKLGIMNKGIFLTLTFVITLSMFSISVFSRTALSTSLICIKLTIDHNRDLQGILSYNFGPVPFCKQRLTVSLQKLKKQIFTSS